MWSGIFDPHLEMPASREMFLLGFESSLATTSPMVMAIYGVHILVEDRPAVCHFQRMSTHLLSSSCLSLVRD